MDIRVLHERDVDEFVRLRGLGFVTYGTEQHALKVGDTYVDEEHMVLWVRPLA